jgi:shikimate kinase
MSERERILITGFMAAGKTTVAAALARRLECRMLDLDQFIVEREGRSIDAIIDGDGEARFREIEESALCEALENDAARIIALGGGTWIREHNRAAIARHNALTIWLDAPFELCWERIASGEETRPLARDEELTRRLYQERRAIYSLAAIHIRVNAADDSEKIVTEILNALQRRTTK